MEAGGGGERSALHIPAETSPELEKRLRAQVERTHHFLRVTGLPAVPPPHLPPQRPLAGTGPPALSPEHAAICSWAPVTGMACVTHPALWPPCRQDTCPPSRACPSSPAQVQAARASCSCLPASAPAPRGPASPPPRGPTNPTGLSLTSHHFGV